MKINFVLQTAKLVGTPGDSVWSQIHCFTPEETLKKEKRGEIMAVLVLEGLGEGVEAVAAGREVLGRLHEEYYGNLEGSAFDRLGQAVEKICQERNKVSIVAATVLNNIVYLAIFGQGKVLLKRRDKIGIILKGEGELVTASGEIQDQDLILLGSEQFFKAIDPTELKSALENNQPEQTVELLAPKILSDSQMAGAVAIVGLFEQKIMEELPEETPLESPETPYVLPKPEPETPKKIFVHRRDFTAKKRLYFLLSLIFLVILGFSFVFGVRKSLQNKKTAQVEKLTSTAQEQLAQAKTVFITEPNQGRQLASEAQNTAKQALEIKPDDETALSISRQIGEFLSSSQQEIELGALPVFMDLSLIEDGVSGIDLLLVGKDLAILDPAKKKVFLLDYREKSNQVFDFDFSEAKYLTSLTDKLVVYSEEGVEEINLISKKSQELIEKDSEWNEIVGLVSFNGNLYLLDRTAPAIWRYLSVNGYASKKNWFIDEPPELSRAVDLAVDGAVWVLGESGIFKYNLGQAENFVLTKMPENFDRPVKLVTSEEMENLYVLDQGKGKIYVIGKNGEFKIAYKGDILTQANDLAVIEAEKKMFVLSSTKIYEIPLR